MKTKKLIPQIPIKLLVALICILITVLMCYLFSIIYIKLTNPCEIPQHIFALRNQTLIESPDGRLPNGALIYTVPSFPIYPEENMGTFDRSNLYYNVENYDGKTQNTGAYERQSDSFVVIY